MLVVSLLAFSFQILSGHVPPATAKSPIPVSGPVTPELYSNLIPKKVLATAERIAEDFKYPEATDHDGQWVLESADHWTSGFLPATLYALNTRMEWCKPSEENGLNMADWLHIGRSISDELIPLTEHNGVGHDVGFLSFPFAEELIVNPFNGTAEIIVNKFAEILAGRYSPVVKATRSWGGKDDRSFKVIIDNMMNLELLFVSADSTDNNTLREIARNHADTTIKNHIRHDGSMWHVIEYDSKTGAVAKKRTQQGFADDSAWSRGQAWGVCGFANMYKRTKDIKYLETARRLADYFIDNIPSDGIVPWDFRAPIPRPSDSSAAAIVAHGLLMMSDLETNGTLKQTWTDTAIRILANTTEHAWNPSWQSLLSGGTVNKPAHKEMTGISYGDYYYILAGNALLRKGLARC